MKKTELKQIIREEIESSLKEYSSTDFKTYVKTTDTGREFNKALLKIFNLTDFSTDDVVKYVNSFTLPIKSR